MKWIGLTGGLGSGKSTVSGILRSKGYPVIDADEIAKQVVRPGQAGLAEVTRQFGQDLLLSDGSLDRRALGRKVFGKPDELLRLESILHPLVQVEVSNRRKAFSTQGFRLAFYDVPLLFEKNLGPFDAIVVVTAAQDLRHERVRARNGWSDEEINRRMAAQHSMDSKIKKANFVIKNDGDLIDLEKEVERVLSLLKTI